MSDEPKKRPRRWIWWPIVTAALYLLSFIPAALVGFSLTNWGAVSDARANEFFNTVYAPIFWATEHSTSAYSAVDWTVETLYSLTSASPKR
jgi:hypothetical protein